MKATFIKTLALGLLAVVTLGLSACKGDDTPNVPPTPSPSTSGEIARVTIKLSMGHLHGKQDFHFVPSSGKYDLRNIYDIQEFTFVKNGDTWSLAPGSPYSDLIAFQLFAWDPKVYSSIAPTMELSLSSTMPRASCSMTNTPLRSFAHNISSSSTPQKLQTLMASP